MGRFAGYVLCLVVIIALTGCASHSSGIAGPDAGFREIGAVCLLLDEDFAQTAEHVLDREHRDAKECAGRMVYNSSRLFAFAPARNQGEFRVLAERMKAGSLDLEEACTGYDNERALRMISEIGDTCRECHGLY